MRFTVLGSGGCTSLPRPLCRCAVCVQARERGCPYARYGCSLYFEDIGAVIDTPEDIVHALNAADIERVDRLFYSHWDPDHTMGMRVVEQLRLSWIDHSQGKEASPIDLFALPGVWRDLQGVRSPFGPFFGYYQQMKLVRPVQAEGPLAFGDIRVHLLPMGTNGNITVFVFEGPTGKLIYAPCDCKPFPESPLLHGADVLLVGNTVVGDAIKGGFVPAPDNFLWRELFSLEEIDELRRKWNIGRVIITHLEEDWGKGFDDYAQLERGLDHIAFACDGMVISV